MPYIKPESRNQFTFYNPRTRGDLNWAITTRLIGLFKSTTRGYADHVEMKAMIMEILQASEFNTDLVKVMFEEFRPETRDIMEEVDILWWGYITATGDCAGAKQVLRDVVDEWNRRLVNDYEDEKIKENGDVY